MMHLTVTTNQEAFDAVVAHLATLKERSVKVVYGYGQTCSYVGAKCAIGALIDKFEGADSGAVRRLVDAKRLDIGEVDIELLMQLQGAHDTSQNWGPDGFEAWPKLAEIAEAFDLDGPAMPLPQPVRTPCYKRRTAP